MTPEEKKSEADYNAKMKKINRALRITQAVFAIVLLYCLQDTLCNSPQHQPTTTDSTSIWKSQAKQAGNAAAVYMTEVSRLQQRLNDKDKQLRDVRAHESQLTITNKGLIVKLRQNAPVDCTPYIDSVDNYHIEIENAKDSSYLALLDKYLVADSASVFKDSVIIQLGVQVYKQSNVIEADSLKIAGLTKQARKGYFKGLLHGTLIGAAIKTGIDLLIGKE